MHTDRFPPHARRRGASLGALIVGLALATLPIAVAGQEADPAAPAAAPAAPGPETVVATVGGETVTESDLAFAAEDLGQELANIPPEQRKAFLLTVLIDMKVMAQAARNEKMDQTEVFKRRLQYLEERALRRAYFAEKISTSVTPETLRAAYDTFVAGFVPQDEVHARHILVATEEDAKAIRASLDAGTPFEQLAKEKSMDPGGANGGDLGFFVRGQMVKPFEDAAFTLAAGQVSGPVQSQFGWHIIKVEEKRQTAPPTFEQVGPQLQQQILFKGFDDAVNALKAGVTIDIPDPALAAGVKAQAEANAAAQ